MNNEEAKLLESQLKKDRITLKNWLERRRFCLYRISEDDYGSAESNWFFRWTASGCPDHFKDMISPEVYKERQKLSGDNLHLSDASGKRKKIMVVKNNYKYLEDKIVPNPDFAKKHFEKLKNT